MRNLEIKCACPDLEAARLRALALGAEDRGLLRQRDTFFACRSGRLKLRDFGDGTGELIAYERPDEPGVRASEYRLHPVTNPPALALLLEQALGPGRVVSKERRLLLFRRTRIHLDRVAGLGSFAELETVLDRPEPELQGREEREAEALRELETVARALGLDAAGRLGGAYLDLMSAAEPDAGHAGS